MTTQDFRRDNEGRIICPQCNTPVRTIRRFIADQFTLHWNARAKRYDCSWDGGDCTLTCGECGQDLPSDSSVRINPIEDRRR